MKIWSMVCASAVLMAGLLLVSVQLPTHNEPPEPLVLVDDAVGNLPVEDSIPIDLQKLGGPDGQRIVFDEGDSGEFRDRMPAVSSVRRRRTVVPVESWIDPKVSPLLDFPSGQVVHLSLFEDTVVPIVLRESRVLNGGGQSIRGTIEGMPEGRFLMTLVDGSASMLIELGPDERYLVNAVGDGLYEIAEINPDALPDCAGAIAIVRDADVASAYLRDGEPGAVSVVIREPSDSQIPESQVDLLVVYGSALETSYPVASIRAKIELAVLEANDDFARSGARVELRLVGLNPVEYMGGSSNIQALGRLEDPRDGYLDDVNGMRDELGADLVCFIPALDDPFSNGIAYVMTNPDDLYVDSSGFSAIDYAVLTGINALSHEVGHNLGCQHDRENATSPGLFGYSFGYRFQGDDGVNHRTIMAYRPGERVSYFSTPDRFFGESVIPVGVAAGMPGESDNVSSLNRGAFGVSNYRLSKGPQGAKARWVNVSTRGVIDNRGRNLITGFVIEGGQETSVLIRGLSPSLAVYGVRDVLSSMRLTLFRGTELVSANMGWGTDPDRSEIEASGFAPGFLSESAIVAALEPGAYTAVMASGDGTIGTGLIETYGSANGQIRAANISSRGVAGHGAEALFGGFVLTGQGTTTHRIIVRVLGPSLADYGLKNLLRDPVLTLYNDQSIPLLTNDDWDRGQHAQKIAAAGYSPPVRRESAILIDLPPGLYTVVVTPFEDESETGDPGYALIEAYELDPE